MSSHAAGLTTGPAGGVVVNASLRTGEPRIHAVGTVGAVGDLVLKTDSVSGKVGLIPLAGPADRQGRLAADAIAGGEVHAGGGQGTAVIGVLGSTAAVTGWNEERLRAAERPHRIVHIHPFAHAGYPRPSPAGTPAPGATATCAV